MKFGESKKPDLLMILSGGQDSTTVLFLAKKQFGKIHAITFDYRQSHDIEIESAKTVAGMAEVDSFEIINIKGVLKSTSPLQGSETLHEYDDYHSMINEVGNSVESTFIPMRNTLFAVIAANRAIARKCTHIGLGVCESDSANYPDCTDAYLSSLQSCITKSLSSGPLRYIDIYAPLVNITKTEAIELAYKDQDCWNALAYTHTSYKGDYPPVHKNHANLLRAKSFEEAGLPDPLILRAVSEGLMDMPTGANYADC